MGAKRDKKVIAYGPDVFIVKLVHSSSVSKLRLDVWKRESTKNNSNRHNWSLSPNVVDHPLPTSATSRVKPTLLDAGVIQGSDGIQRLHVLVSFRDSSRLFQLRTSSVKQKHNPSGRLFQLNDLGLLPEFSQECRLLDGPTVVTLQKDDRLMAFDVASKCYAVSSSRLMARDDRQDPSAQARLVVAERLVDDTLFLVVVRGSILVISDVFRVSDKRLLPIASPSTSSAVPSLFRRSVASIFVASADLIDDDDQTLETDLLIVTTQKSVYRVRNGCVLSFASMDFQSSAVDVRWHHYESGNEEKLVAWSVQSKEVAVLIGDQLLPNDDAASALAARMIDCNEFRLVGASVDGAECLCVYGERDGVASLNEWNLLAEVEKHLESKLSTSPPVKEGARAALTGFQNVVRSAVAAAEKEERRLDDKAEMIRMLLKRLEGHRVISHLGMGNRDVFRLCSSSGSASSLGVEHSNVPTKRRKVSKLEAGTQFEFTLTLQATVSNHILVLHRVSPRLDGCGLLAIHENQTGRTPFQCRILSHSIDDNSSWLLMVVPNPLVFHSDVRLSILDPTESCRLLTTFKVNLTSLKPLSLSPSTYETAPKNDALLWTLKSTKIHAPLTLISAEMDLPSNHYLFEGRLHFEVITQCPQMDGCVSDSSLPSVVFSMEQRTSPLFGCVAVISEKQSSRREARFHIFVDSLSQLAIFVQSLYQAAPENCLILSERQYRARFSEKRTARELLALTETYIAEKRELYLDYLKHSTPSRNPQGENAQLAKALQMEGRLTKATLSPHTILPQAVRNQRNTDISQRYGPSLLPLLASLDE